MVTYHLTCIIFPFLNYSLAREKRMEGDRTEWLRMCHVTPTLVAGVGDNVT